MKRFILSSVLVPIVFLSTAEARAECLSIAYTAFVEDSINYPVSMTYDTAVGVTFAMYRYKGSYTARVPKLISGQPNPDFDRIYGLLLKAYANRTISSFCFSGTVSAGAVMDITSVTVFSEELQRVAICDPSSTHRCASVDVSTASKNELRTTK